MKTFILSLLYDGVGLYRRGTGTIRGVWKESIYHREEVYAEKGSCRQSLKSDFRVARLKNYRQGKKG